MSSNDAQLSSFEVHVKSDRMSQRNVGYCTYEALAHALVSENLVVGKSHDLSESVVTLPTQADTWIRSSALECKNPAVCSRSPFFPSASFSPRCHPSALFCSLFLSTFFVIFPVCYTSSFLTSHPCFLLWSVVQHVLLPLSGGPGDSCLFP